jgi:hypothetical protein
MKGEGLRVKGMKGGKGEKGQDNGINRIILATENTLSEAKSRLTTSGRKCGKDNPHVFLSEDRSGG